MKLRTILLVLALLAFLSASIGGYFYYASLRKSVFREAERVAATQAAAVKERMSSHLSENLQIIRALARIRELRHALVGEDASSIERASSLLSNLDYFDDALGYDACYLMDRTGRAVASSNRDDPDGFMQGNHMFSPYFRMAIQGTPSFYMLRHRNRQKPGVYFSHPVYGENKDIPIGVVVIKASIEPIENELRRFHQGIVIVTDTHGVIFASSREDWLYQRLWKTSSDDVGDLGGDQKGLRGLSNTAGLKLRGERYAVDRSGNEYLIYKMNLVYYPGWNVIYLVNLAEISKGLPAPLLGIGGYAILILCLLVGVSVLFLYRIASHDIVQRMFAEDALRESEERYRAVVEDMPAMVCRFLPDGTLTFVNTPYCFYLGKQKEELLGQNFFQFIPEEEQEQVRRHFISLTRKTPMITYELQVIAPDGSVRWQQWTDRALFGEQGVLVEYQSTGLDITERKLAHEEKAKLEKQLQQAQKMEAVGTLAGGIAHDFNNLLHLLQSHAELVLLSNSVKQPGEERIRDIIRAVERGSKLTRQLLTFSRKIESNLRPTDLNQEVAEVKELLSRTIPKMVQIEIHLAEDLKPINGDAVQLEQVLMNLAINAKDAMPAGGKLIIATENLTIHEEDEYGHAELTPGEYVLLTVADTGQGMDTETLERVFEPFFSSKSPGEGTGLGLAMVYGIIQNHDGHISCESKVGEGTTFRIHLPAIGPVEKSWEKEIVKEPEGGSETILLVDDEASILETGEQILSRYGYTILSAANGEEALDLYRRKREQIELVILDLVMPGMGGSSCLEELLKIDPQVQVIVASGYSPERPAREEIDARVNGFISKPYNLREMLNAVREVLDSD